MLTKADYFENQENKHAISDRNFNKILSDIKLLSPLQLKSLQEQVQGSLKESEYTLLTDEELDTISSLFGV